MSDKDSYDEVGAPSLTMERYPAKAVSSERQEILNRLTAIEAAIKNLSKRYTWEDQTSETGIQLQGSSATITRKGVLIAAAPIPVGPNQMTLGFILQDESGKIHMLPADHVKQVQD